eukprot:3339574-Amphidinium_carterae.1
MIFEEPVLSAVDEIAAETAASEANAADMDALAPESASALQPSGTNTPAADADLTGAAVENASNEARNQVENSGLLESADTRNVEPP